MPGQRNLFAAEGTAAVKIASRSADRPLSKQQKTFNSLIRQIEKRRERLAGWQTVTPAFHEKYTSQLLPLQQTLAGAQTRLVYRLDQVHSRKGITRGERNLLSVIIAELAVTLLSGREDAQLKELYNRHGGSNYDAEETAAAEDFKSTLEDLLGLELPDEPDFSSPEEFFAQARAQLDAREEARAQRSARRKKSPEQLAREAQQQAEAEQVSRSIREVYRKLASVLHPDREADAQERARKTALMQRVNQAYDNNNLLLLLELQLELEHIDQNAIGNIGDEKLKHYNKVLREQVADLDREVAETETRFAMQYGLSPFIELSPRTALDDLAMDIAELENAIRRLEADLAVLADDSRVKKWIANVRRDQRETVSFGIPL
jgi:hypothetical protein